MNVPPFHADPVALAAIRSALREDLGAGDPTSEALVPGNLTGEARIVSKGAYVLAGGDVACAVFRETDAALQCRAVVSDGRAVGAGDVVLEIRGSARAILAAERTALNFLQRLTGIATHTRRFVESVRRYGTQILDTRKTTPGLRAMERHAVVCGGGVNHRFGLFDRVLIKDNHRRIWKAVSGRGLDEAVRQARKRYPGLLVEIEVDSLAELDEALPARPDWVLCDNMDPETLRRCVERCRGVARTEASGGISLATVQAVAETGVDAVSLGCLTHSSPAADLSLEMD